MIDKGFWEGSETAHSPLATLPVDELYDILDYMYHFEKEDWIESDKPRDHFSSELRRLQNGIIRRETLLKKQGGLNNVYQR